MFRSREGREQLGAAKRVESSKPGVMLSRRRAITILVAVIGLPLLPSADQSKTATRLHRWRGTALGSPSYLLIRHPDCGAAERAIAKRVAELARLVREFSLYR